MLAAKGDILTEEQAKAIQNAGVNRVSVLVNDPEAGEIPHIVIGNNTVDFSALSQKDPKPFGLLATIYYPNFVFSKEIAEACKTRSVEEVAEEFGDRINKLYHELPEADRQAKEIDEEKEKKEERKNREKRRDNRIKFVSACVLFHEILARSEEPAPICRTIPGSWEN